MCGIVGLWNLNGEPVSPDPLKEVGCDLKGARIAVLGYAYLEDSDDTRNSPSEVLVRLLRELGADPVIHDPWIHEYGGALYKRIKGCDAAVVMVAHSAYKSLDLGALLNALKYPILVDGRKVFDPQQAYANGITYRRVGSAL